LKACTDAMADESRQAIEQLRREVEVYQSRVGEAERLACVDALTGLENRRGIDAAIAHRLARRKMFSILMLDLNEFKTLNNTCGHLAGDEILKQFSAELKGGFRPTETVGRWGGDEFLVILDSGLKEANAHADRIERWVCGDYTVHIGNVTRRVPVTASIGTAEWKPTDTRNTLIDRADAALYRHKRAAAK